MSAGGGQSRSRQSSVTQPWTVQQPFLRQIYGEAQGLYGGPELQYFPGSTVAGRDPFTEQSLSALFNRAQAPSPAEAAAGGYTADVLSGRYLDPNLNPGLGAYADQFRREYLEGIGSGLETKFGGAGWRTPESGAYQAARRNADLGFGEKLSQLYGRAYEGERGRQQQAAAFAPQLGQFDLRRIGAGVAAGQEREAFAQRQLDDLTERFYFEQFEPYERLRRYSEFIGQPVSESVSRGSSSAWNAQASLFG